MALLLITSVHAKQFSFTKKVQEDNYNFSYQWLDRDKVRQSISFNLSKPALFERFRMLKPYQGEFAQKTILRTIKKQLRQQPLIGAHAVFKQQQGETVIQVKGLDEEKVAAAYQKIKIIEQEVTKKYFQKNYYQRFTTHDQQTGIKVDHVNIALDSVSDLKVLKPIILDRVSIENIRKVTNFVLSFVQSIPYSTLESRLTSSGAGFNPPAKLLWENQGDCDSKMTLTATILRALMPRIDMAMIYIDQHAFIGIAIPSKANEVSIEFQGINYLLAEPTGPALYKLGSLAPESELAINQGRYVVEEFHSDGSY
ncbi:hypothetical protein [Candidatus Colwellia aromaticivorans]|uniref:hypothetical protein n=1 Tax=Candidatus Colwellia aromaticivorans TaxID=2267621 RepID=UPI001FE4C413|nr:hypothetical protein [Candidatus Colwellia aromaticivorans]